MLLFYTPNITNRLQYIVDFISTELFSEPITITTDKDLFLKTTSPCINYSEQCYTPEEFFLHAAPLLFETAITAQKINCFTINNYKAFFKTAGDFPFDILAASFYLISRYEEYLPHTTDEYGRYAHTNALAFKENFLNTPLVNIWLQDFKNALKNKFPSLQFKIKKFTFIPSYDIDIAFSYQAKGLLRNTGGFVKAIQQKQWSLIKERWAVLYKKQKDPFDAYEWLNELHKHCKVNPIYFFLVAQKQQGYDKNISPSAKTFQILVKNTSGIYKTGLHPSWQSSIHNEQNILQQEKTCLEKITGSKIEHSRQHYIKFTLPQGYNRLIANGLLKDYSMGYGSINGFRASVASSFYWFNVIENKATALQIFPFCFMDANAFYEQKMSAEQAYKALVYYYHIIKKTDGLFITIWHNNFLGADKNFTGWKNVYAIFMKEIVYWDAHKH